MQPGAAEQTTINDATERTRTAIPQTPLWATPKFIALAILFTLAAAAILIIHHARSSPHLVLSSTVAISLPADGRWHRTSVHLRLSDRSQLSPSNLLATSTPALETRLLPDRENSLLLLVRSPVTPRASILLVRQKSEIHRLPLHFLPDLTETSADGTPDFLLLHTPEDRENFRQWFTGIAEHEAALPVHDLPPEINDCAALLRFSYRNALSAHDEPWLSSTHMDELSRLPSVTGWHYPETPLGANLFRVRPGPFTSSNLTDGSFAQFADAETLLRQNTFFVGRNLSLARPGDLLFFRQLEQNSPFHSMIVTEIGGPGSGAVVYHTGPIGTGKGEIRELTLPDLLTHPDRRWRPVPENSNFLGVHRWSILREDR